MSEPVRRTDDESVEGVAPIQAQAGGRIGSGVARPLAEIRGPILVRAGQGFAVVVDLVEFVERGGSAVLGFLGDYRRDAHTEFDRLSEPTAQCLGDLGAQVAFDLVLDEAARHRQQGKTFDDLQRLHEVEPRSLLRSQRCGVLLAVSTGAVRGEFAIEL